MNNFTNTVATDQKANSLKYPGIKQYNNIDMDYAVIIPAKNEQSNIGLTLSSLANQTLRPKLVLVMDNSSRDNTEKIIKEYQAKHDFIRYFSYSGDPSYSLGGKIVRMFNEGKRYIDESGIHYDYIVKMDADIQLRKDIFEKIAYRIKQDNYGIISPLAYSNSNGKSAYVSSPDWHTLGDFKVYNRQCFESMGGLKEDLGWDCADNITAMQLGYKTMIFRDIRYEQNRPIGRYSILNGLKRQGMGAYKLRYGLFYLSLKSVHDLFKPPFFTGSFYYLSGYFDAIMKKEKHTLTKEQGKIFRKLLWKSFYDRINDGHFYMLQALKRNNGQGNGQPNNENPDREPENAVNKTTKA